MGNQATAFARADQARTAIATIIESVRSAERDLSGAFELADANPLIGRCFAVKVFEVVPDVGKVRARRAMDEIGLAEDVWLADVPVNKRLQIIELLQAS